MTEVRAYILSWRGYYGSAEVTSPLLDLNKWIRRRLGGHNWKQWCRRGCRTLRARAIFRDQAWNTAESVHGTCCLSKSLALAIGLVMRYLPELGLPSQVEGRTDQ